MAYTANSWVRYKACNLRWSTTAASLVQPPIRDALAPQDQLYARNGRGNNDDYAVIGSIDRILVALKGPVTLAHPMTRTANPAVTGKAYCLDPTTGTLYQAHPDILHDVWRPRPPRPATGTLVAALARPQQAGPHRAQDRLGNDKLGNDRLGDS